MNHCLRCLLCATVMWLAGCASHEAWPSYFVLTAASTQSAATPHGPRIFIRRVDIPGYLQTTKLASRRQDTQIEYATTALWAEPLAEGIAHGLGEALDRTGNVTVVGAIGGGIPPGRDVDLKLVIQRFEGDDHGQVVLVAEWSLFAPESAVPILTRRSRIVQSGWTYGDDAGLARLLGEDLDAWAGEIARSVRR